ncbi:hypothetical protein JIN85_13250 [Luteolibacter pohnpeiensis]|uniref:Uncharacterized protein n=1 Tax=Luteolibacter pohnpeiensis TaxID=454153 RepID=A0A934VRM9_9BACT|nr:hypothetical protein [Luteolibacter pohnpeiensis]MBK1883386.1 hypothetical protein [Luteolibacter pohnpeiensis]
MDVVRIIPVALSSPDPACAIQFGRGRGPSDAKVTFMKWLTIVVPVLCLIGGFVDEFFPLPFSNKEFGIMENLTVLFLALSILILLFRGFRGFGKMRPLDRMVLIVLLLGSIYFLGEEISWGQHFFGFHTPEGYRELNYQGETNLHNLGGELNKKLFDRLPRLIVGIGVFFSGIIFPFIPNKLPEWIRRYVPGKDVVFTSILAVGISLPSKVYRMITGVKDGFDAGEAKEMYIALFILLFCLAFLRMLKKERQNSVSVPN